MKIELRLPLRINPDINSVLKLLGRIVRSSTSTPFNILNLKGF